MRQYVLQGVNLSLRGVNLISKFILVVFIAKAFSPEELASYGLVVATISYCLYLVGLDFYTYSTREFIKADSVRQRDLLKSHIALILLLYSFILPALLILFLADLLPWKVAVWFYLLLIFEHLNQELMRLLIALRKPILATLSLFVRSGLWAVVLVIGITSKAVSVSLDNIFLYWLIGEVFALFICLVALKSLLSTFGKNKLDWSWVRKGVRMCVPFLVGTLAIRSVWTVDKYLFETFNSPALLGAYVLFVSLASAMSSFMDAGVHAFLYPKMIYAYKNKQMMDYKGLFLVMMKQTIFVSLAFMLGAYWAVDYLLLWLDRSVYSEHKSLLFWLLGVNFLYCVSMVPHYVLYAQNKDKEIVMSHFVTLLVFLLVLFSVTFVNPIYIVPLSLCLAFAVLLLLKSVMAIKYFPTNLVSR